MKDRSMQVNDRIRDTLGNTMSDHNVKNRFDDVQRREKYKKWYLFCYNSIQTFGWISVLYQVIYYNIVKPDRTLYHHVQYTLTFFQTAACLEIIHAFLKLTSSNPFVTVQQVYSRVMMVIGILLLVEESRTTIGFQLVLFAWSITEIIRYSNYALATFDCTPGILVWLRYTTFIILYPIGVTGELLCMYWAVRQVARTKQYCLEFPNEWNMMFYYHYFILGVMSLYVPFFPQLYLHMFTLRKKVLGKLKEKTK